MPSDHIPECHISIVVEHLQGKPLHHILSLLYKSHLFIISIQNQKQKTRMKQDNSFLKHHILNERSYNYAFHTHG